MVLLTVPKNLNLGCGPRFCADDCWTNVDFVSASPRVIAHNLNAGLPFPDQICDVVYHSHVLEHFQVDDGKRFMAECFRVLRPGGFLRVAVPDLEQICRLYLDSLEKVEAGDAGWRGKYDWIKLEMYDQTVRTVPGGAMAEYLRQPNLPHKDFIVSRAGNIASEIMKAATANQTQGGNTQARQLKRALSKLRHAPSKLSKLIRMLLLSEHEKRALELGLFRLGGEIHQWMYDGYSLRTLLEEAGFKGVRRTSATESSIPQWNNYYLDVDKDGCEHAPSSLYMEAVRPR